MAQGAEMSLLRNIVTTPTYKNRDGGSLLSVSLTSDDTGNHTGFGFGTQQEYVVKLTVGTTVWANDAQRSDAERLARRVILDTLYRDSLQLVHIALLAAHNRDFDAVCESLSTLRNNMTEV
jgi:hypothetical protein